jgi:hypothetical protein
MKNICLEKPEEFPHHSPVDLPSNISWRKRRFLPKTIGEYKANTQADGLPEPGTRRSGKRAKANGKKPTTATDLQKQMRPEPATRAALLVDAQPAIRRIARRGALVNQAPEGTPIRGALCESWPATIGLAAALRASGLTTDCQSRRLCPDMRRTR